MITALIMTGVVVGTLIVIAAISYLLWHKGWDW